MDRTQNLIDKLSTRTPTMPGSKWLAFAMPLVSAALAGVLSLMILLGLPFQPVAENGWGPVLGKLMLLLPMLIAAVASLWALAIPARRSSLILLLALVPLGLMVAGALLEFTGRRHAFPGETWLQCLLAMILIGAIGMTAAIYSLRLMAPVRQRRAGAASGLFGGALAGCAYSPFCPELGAAYMLAFYGAPIAALAAIGWATGPRLLRW